MTDLPKSIILAIKPPTSGWETFVAVWVDRMRPTSGRCAEGNRFVRAADILSIGLRLELNGLINRPLMQLLEEDR